VAQMTTNTWQQVFTPRWASDFRSRDHLVPGGVKLLASQFSVEDAVTVTSPAGAAIGATSIPVNAISGPIPSGTILDWTGTGEYSRLTSNAIAGATSLAVEALDVAIEGGDTATYPGTKKKYVPSGKILGLTEAEFAAGTAWGPWASGDDYCRLLAFAIEDVADVNDGVLYRPGSVVKVNLLPEAPITGALLTALRGAYVLQRGVA
jgi:hypothetical protein